MATQFGTNGVFGIPDDQTGLIIDGATYSYSNENKVLRNRQGGTIGKAYYDERCEVSLAGFIPSAAAFSGTLASAISLGTAVTDYFINSTVGASTIVETITRTHASEEYQRLEIGAINHALI
jgi:hypothetical protein